jgi:hypothetical protein
MTVNKASLEDRYRRILRLYPADHRRDHEDEMIGVLLADDRTRPDLRDVCDLAWGALLIRLRRATGTFSEERWHDAFAIVGIIAPILLIGLSLRPLASNVGKFVFSHRLVMHGTTPLRSAEFLAEEELLWLAFCAVAVLALLGVRRVGTVAAFALPAVTVGLMFSSYGALSWQAAASADLPVVLSLLTGVALWASPPARHGRHLLGRRVLILIPIVMAYDVETIEWPTFPALHNGSLVVVTAATVLTIVGVVSMLRSAAGRRACALLTVVLSCLLYSAAPIVISAAPLRVVAFLIMVPLAGFTIAATGIRLLERAAEGLRR